MEEFKRAGSYEKEGPRGCERRETETVREMLDGLRRCERE